MIEIVIKVGMWLIFALLCTYVFVSSRKSRLKEYTGVIRKIWYLIFIMGCLVFLTGDPSSLTEDWKKFLIVLVVFVVIDSLLFLELHISKLGGQELRSAKQQVGITQDQLDTFITKSRHIPDILTLFQFPMYNVNKDEYIEQLEQLLEEYGLREKLDISLYPYGTDEEKEYLLENLGKLQNKARRMLSRSVSLLSTKDTLALYPFTILENIYVVQVETVDEEDKILEIDGDAIATLIVAYNLTVTIKNYESGEEHGNKN